MKYILKGVMTPDCTKVFVKMFESYPYVTCVNTTLKYEYDIQLVNHFCENMTK